MPLADDLIQTGVLKTPRIISAFRAIRRADFLPPEERLFADLDEPIPIGEGQTISQPYTVAFMLELLQPRPGQTILDVGYGSGWQSALLAHIVTDNKKTTGRVFAIERISALCAFGKENISAYSYITSGVVETFCGDAVTELDEIAKPAGGFDGIIVAASAPGVSPAEQALPRAWKRHLNVGGKIIFPIGESIWVFTKRKNGSLDAREYPGFIFVPFVVSKKKTKLARFYAIKQFFIKLPVLLIILAGIFSVSAFFLLFLFLAPPNKLFPKEVTIPRNISARETADLLNREGIIRSHTLLLAILVLHNDVRNVQAGTYFFEQPESLVTVARKIVDPATRKILTIRIPEGATLRGIAEEYERRNIFAKDELWAVTGTPAVDYRFATDTLPDFSGLIEQFLFLQERPAHATLEGFLIADTYELFDNVTPGEIVFAMLKNFQQRLTDEGLFDEIQKQNRSLYEVLILASLLEKEAIYFEDKRIIAGIIQNRLERDMPLQIDASLMYVTGRGSALLTKEDLMADHPYNTYVHNGLPLGPVASPGVESIKAALFPEETPYLYYLSDRSLTIHYSRTFDEHKTKKAMYIP